MTTITLPDGLISTAATSSDLVGVDGNAFSIMGFVRRELKRAGNSADVVNAYTEQAQADDYDHLLRVSMEFLDA